MQKTKRRKSSSHPAKGWSKISPRTIKERKNVLRKCGRKCFVGPNRKKLSYPICSKYSCKIHRKGILAAKMRAMSRKQRLPRLKKYVKR